jgi:hypothetical protein
LFQGTERGTGMTDLREPEQTSERILSDLRDVYPRLSPQLRRAAHYLLGPNAARVARHADQSVLIVR